MDSTPWSRQHNYRDCDRKPVSFFPFSKLRMFLLISLTPTLEEKNGREEGRFFLFLFPFSHTSLVTFFFFFFLSFLDTQ